MRLFHGTGAWDPIRETGLIIPDSDNRTFAEDDAQIASLHGVYMSDRVDIAAFYAIKSVNSEAFIAGYPAFFVIETDPDHLTADEDKIDFAVMRVIERGTRIRDGEAPKFMEDLGWRRASVLDSLKQDLLLGAEITDDEIWEGVRGFVYRKGDVGWPFELEDTDQNVGDLTAAINRLCEAARATINHRWMTRYYGEDYCLSCRSTTPIGAHNGLIGGAQLLMSNDGMSIIGVDTFGDVSEDEIEAFKASSIQYYEEISTCVVEDRTSQPGLAA